MPMISDRARALLPRALMLLAGAISALGFAPLSLWPLPFLGLALLIEQVMRAAKVRDAFGAGWWFGFASFLVCLNWIATAFTFQENMPAWIGWLGVLLLSAYLGLFPALAAALAWRLSHHQRLGFVLLFAASWMLCEWLRSGLLGGFAWNPIAVIWLPLPAIAQAAKWIGTYGMSGLVVLAAGLLWLGVRTRWRATAAAALLLVVLGTWLGRGTASAPPAAVSGIAVRIVQPNISQDTKYDPAQAEANLLRYVVLSGEPSQAPRLLLWPEGALVSALGAQLKKDESKKSADKEPLGQQLKAYQLEEESAEELRGQLARLLGPHDILLTGGPSVEFDPYSDDDVYHNSVFALDSKGRLPWRYDKAHLVPFGEFLPLRPILERIGLSRLVPGDGDFSPGPGPRTFDLPGFMAGGKPASVAVQICYEIIFPGRVVDESHRPSFLFNPSNDAWFGAWGPPQHLAQAQLRAIEEGLPIIRATPNGISAVIGPTGRLLAWVPRHTARVIDTSVPEALPPTLFSRLGLWTCVLFGLGLGAAGILASRAGGSAARTTAGLLQQPRA
jgi:apolipoprotein N-acyltransferase